MCVCACAHVLACSSSLCMYENEGVGEYEWVYLNGLYDIMVLAE